MRIIDPMPTSFQRSASLHYQVEAADLHAHLFRITLTIAQPDVQQQVSLPVSTLLRGEYGQDGIFIGVPAVIGRTGVQRVVELELDATETEQFARSASALRAVSEQFEVLR